MVSKSIARRMKCLSKARPQQKGLVIVTKPLRVAATEICCDLCGHLSHAERTCFGVAPDGVSKCTCGQAPSPLTLRELQDLAHAHAKNKGFIWSAKDFPTMIALLHTELSEALESWRNNEETQWFGEDGKPEGVAAELADAAIRLADTASVMDVDLEEAIELKMAYNATRAHRHGGKRI